MTPESHSFFEEFIEDYFAESEEHLAIIRRILLRLEEDDLPRSDPGLLDELFRSFHSLKGTSGMVGLREAELLSHHMESYLRLLQEGRTAASDGGVDMLIEATRCLEEVIAARRAERPIPDISAAVARIEAVIASGAGVASAPTAPSARRMESLTTEEGERLAAAVRAGARLWRFDFAPSAVLAARGINVNVVRERLRDIGELIRTTPVVTPNGGVTFWFLVASHAEPELFALWANDGLTCKPHSEFEEVAPARTPVEPAAGPVTPLPTTSQPLNVVRVELARLDELMHMVGELVVARSHLDENLKAIESEPTGAALDELRETGQVISRQLRSLREAVMRARMVPVGEIFERMQFVVRDLARESRKKVRLELSGQKTEIDKFLVERMLDPLLHLVRNALSHGLEAAEERVAMGKPPEGTIALRASTAGEIVVLEVEDDGRGVDSERVLARARAAGLPAPTDPGDMNQLLELICMPGFSTRDEIDMASGRGVGMAVVKNAIVELGGTITLESEARHGTRFVIQLPLTLAITDALLVIAGGQRFAVLQGAVREVIEIQPDQVRQLETHEILPHRGGALPLVRLSRIFNLPETSRSVLHGLVVGTGTSQMGVVVDRIVGQREVVVRTMSDPLLRVPGVTGATELGDGRPVLIVNAAALSGSIGRRRSHAALGGR